MQHCVENFKPHLEFVAVVLTHRNIELSIRIYYTKKYNFREVIKEHYRQSNALVKGIEHGATNLVLVTCSQML
jgi:hypothetical protein